MGRNIIEEDDLMVTAAAIRCEACGTRPGPNYQINTHGGYIKLCGLCVERISTAIRADQVQQQHERTPPGERWMGR